MCETHSGCHIEHELVPRYRFQTTLGYLLVVYDRAYIFPFLATLSPLRLCDSPEKKNNLSGLCSGLRNLLII